MGRRDESSWTTIESDPGVFTELIENIGVQGVQVEEIWSLDKESLMNLSPVWGLVFLFKYVKDAAKRNEVPQPQDDVFFAQQVIPNACATQAILNILLNLPASSQGVTLGPELTAFREFTADLPPDMKGLAISNSDLIRTVHNSLARPESLLPDEDQKQQQEGDAFHFVAYLPVHGSLYELDGLQPAPICLATDLNTEGAWLEAVIPHISSRMERYAAGEVRFNLMALVADRRATLEQQIAQCRSQRDAATEDDKSTQQVLDDELNRLQHELAQEHARRQTWKEENVRRRQNYIPLMFNLLKALADADQLKQFIELAKQPKKPKKETAAAESMQE